MRSPIFWIVIACALASISGRSSGASGAPHEARMKRAMDVHLADVQWTTMFPALGARSPAISILREDPVSHATQLLIRTPRNFHVTRHWHTANETHTIVSGAFVMRCEGGALDTLRAGDFNYVPSRMVHEAWTLPGEDALIFITVDRGWDVHFVGAPPTPLELEKTPAAAR